LAARWLGNYGDIVKLALRFETKTPVVVLSRRGDWPEYLRAVVGGAFDYLAYPPIVGDLQRVILKALLWNKPNLERVEVP
jgi:DNA-binding NtrC family response regulator